MFDLLRAVRTVVSRDLLVVMRNKSEVANCLLFFALVASLFPLGIGPEPGILRTVASGVIWVAALLASMLALSRLFSADYLDGTLEQMTLSPYPLPILLGGKIIAHWLVSGFPLVVIAPLLGVQFGLASGAQTALVISLLLGTPVLSILGALGAALTLGLRSGGGLVPLLVLPLCVPVLIFGAGAIDAAASGLEPAPHLSLLAAYLLPSALFGPWVAAVAIRIALE